MRSRSLAPLVVLGGGQFLGAFNGEQLQAMALLSLKLYALTFTISFAMFALFELAIGYLIIRSTLLPRFLGVWMVIGGLGWLTYMWLPLATSPPWYVLALGAGEVVLMLWLLVKGVDADGSGGARATNRSA